VESRKFTRKAALIHDLPSILLLHLLKHVTAILRGMATLLSNHVLYKDVPQRHYRQIAAKADGRTSFVQIWEGTIVQLEPFEHENPDAEIVFCGSNDEATTEAAKVREESLRNGWFDYDHTLK
jgi:hypothetical protein